MTIHTVRVMSTEDRDPQGEALLHDVQHIWTAFLTFENSEAPPAIHGAESVLDSELAAGLNECLETSSDDAVDFIRHVRRTTGNDFGAKAVAEALHRALELYVTHAVHEPSSDPW